MTAKNRTVREQPNILIPTNFTGHAVIAGEYAARLLEGSPCNIILETVYQAPKGSAGTLIRIADILLAEAEEKLRKECKQIEFGAPGLHIDFKAEEGDAATVIGNNVKKDKIDLLVIGHNSHVKKFLYSFIGKPDSWPALLVPNNATSLPERAIIVCGPETADSRRKPGISAIENRLKGKTRTIYFSKNEPVIQLKRRLETEIANHNTDILVFKTEKGSELEAAIKMHSFDELLLICPALLLSY